ncbi:molecular chaperone [Enterobacteriaceae bacterium H4N4]|uniref:Molecular chaperone n=1 Tax=Silvania confinis TaxID=2926470 RepID=A0A9J6QB97_9ENTR|nr:molecular chaperone [Silvania confinis]MCU6668257.1 molecular chaperone [Silvania confinis]
MKLLMVFILSLFATDVFAAVQIESSRVIYPGEHKSASLTIHNVAKKNYIVQTWLDADDGNRNKTMVVTPPLLKLLPDQSTVLRSIYSGTGLPTDRESVIWINVQEIPPRASEPNVMQLAVRTRLKLFYRPVALKTTLAGEVDKLKIKKFNDALVINNNGPLHVSLNQLVLRNVQGLEKRIPATMISPFSVQTINFSKGSKVVGLTYINDHGGIAEVKMD